ncbi:MAG: hypothetical protein KA270_13175 [Saprospiraceae bacterium]|nr:hypothetical protein [Saprospiraceae bacterium]MBP6568116.1 hypothetical protein [Saprospiraceae bacterium]
MKGLILFFAIMCLFSCKTKVPKAEIGSQMSSVTGHTSQTITSDSLINNPPYNMFGDGIFGRRVIYRDLSVVSNAVNGSGKVAIKVCINRAGLVTFVELINHETTERNRENLKLYMKAARTYKYQPDLTAPKEQCGKLTFIVENTINNKLKK